MEAGRHNLAARFAPVVIVLAGVCAYWNCFPNAFFLDDMVTIVANPNIRAVWPLTRSMHTEPQFPLAARPVVSLTFAINYAIGGLDPRGWHAVNLAVHIGTALLLFGIVRRTLRTSRAGGWRDDLADKLALCAALLFAVHPLNTEVVNYVMQRTESMVGLCTAGALYCFIRGTQSNRSAAWYVAATATCAVGMGCKEIMVAAPLLVLVYDWMFIADSPKELIARRGMAHAGIWSSLLVLIYLIWDSPRSQTSSLDFAMLTPWNYLKTQAGVLVHYLKLTVWPSPLCVDYCGWPLVMSVKEVWWQGCVVVLLLAATMLGIFKRWPIAYVGAVFFFTLAPTSSFIPLSGEYASERRMYLPLAAILPAIVIGGYLGLRRWIGSSGTLVGATSLGVVLVLFGYLCVERNRDYATDELIWRDTIVKRPNNARAWANYAAILYRENQLEDATNACRTAIKLDPVTPRPHDILGAILAHFGQYAGAVKEFRESIRLFDNAKSRGLLANAYAEMGRDGEAVAEFRRAIKLDPNDAALHDGCGFVLARQGKTGEAMAEFAEAIRIDPALAGAYYDLALAQQAEGNWAGAVKNLQTALAREPEKVTVIRALAWALAVTPDEKAANSEEAIRLAEKAASMRTDDADVMDALAAAYARAGRFDEAIAMAEKAAAAAEKYARPSQANVIRAREAMYRKKQAFIQPMPATRSGRQSAVSWAGQ